MQSHTRRCESEAIAASLSPKWAGANEIPRTVPLQSVKEAARAQPGPAVDEGLLPAFTPSGSYWPGRGGGSSCLQILTTPSTPPVAKTVPNSGSAQESERTAPSCAFHVRGQ